MGGRTTKTAACGLIPPLSLPRPLRVGWGCFWSSLMFCPSSKDFCGSCSRTAGKPFCWDVRCAALRGSVLRTPARAWPVLPCRVMVPNCSLPQNLPRPPGCNVWNVFSAPMFSSRHQEGANGALGSGELQETGFTAHILATRGPLDRAPLHQGAAGRADHNPGSPRGQAHSRVPAPLSRPSVSLQSRKSADHIKRPQHSASETGSRSLRSPPSGGGKVFPPT